MKRDPRWTLANQSDRTGVKWSAAESAALLDYVRSSGAVAALAELHGRSESAIAMELFTGRANTRAYGGSVKEEEVKSTTKEETMSNQFSGAISSNHIAGTMCNSTSIDGNIAVQTVTFIHGRDSAQVTDEQLFDLIRAKEVQIKRLDEIENKPNALAQRIRQLRADIVSLVNFCDTRSKTK